jgi:hypothetical protein
MLEALMKAKDIFGLAVRLLGLFFLYLGLYAVVPAVKQIYDLGTIPDAGRDDVIEAIISGPLIALIYLIVAVWLLRTRMLVRWAYPEAANPSEKIAEHFVSPVKPLTSSPETIPAPETARVDRAEEKLAALVEKPKQNRVA